MKFELLTRIYRSEREIDRELSRERERERSVVSNFDSFSIGERVNGGCIYRSGMSKSSGVASTNDI